jgi:hypothetical protein
VPVREAEPWREDPLVYAKLSAQRQVVRNLVADYERRRRLPHGRLLLWLLRKTT